MPSSTTNRHPTWTQTYRDRANLANTSPLAAYLLRLIAIKKTNLCLSADVTTTSELISLAEEVGDSICLLKTHADIISDFSDRTIRALRDVAKRRRFLIFEDRKFADIGGTVQKQYTSGPLGIAKWAEITNAHILPGPAIVMALKEAASHAISAYNMSIQTEISASPVEGPSASSSPTQTSFFDPDGLLPAELPPDRKASVVSISTTISTRTENIKPDPTPDLDDSTNGESADSMLDRLGSPRFLRGLLLLAEMSSEGNFFTPEYTRHCVDMARQNPDFVLGFIAQRSLNEEEGDNFITMTPGVKLPPPGHTGPMGDGLGQQYNTPRLIVYEQGSDVVIVGRGITRAVDRHAEAERYRREAWGAYEERVGIRRTF